MIFRITLSILLTLAIGAAVGVGLGSAFVVLAHAQDKSKADPPTTVADKLAPTPEQAKDLKIAQQDAIIARQSLMLAQQAVQEAQAKFEAAVKKLDTEGERVKRENKWGDDVEMNDNTLEFARKSPPPAKAQPKP